MADQHARFEMYLDPNGDPWKGQVTPNKVNLRQRYPTTNGEKGFVVIGINANDGGWHAQIPGMRPLIGSYDDVTEFLVSEGIEVPEKGELIEKLYDLAPRAQFAYNVLSNLRET